MDDTNNFLWNTNAIEILQKPIITDINIFNQLCSINFFRIAEINDIDIFFDYFNTIFIVYLKLYFKTIKEIFYNIFSDRISSPNCICGNYKKIIQRCNTIFHYNTYIKNL